MLAQHYAPEIVSLAEASLGGLRGRAALLVGSEIQRQPYKVLLQQANTTRIYQEEHAGRIVALLPQVQLLMHMPDSSQAGAATWQITAAAIAQGCAGRRAPLVVFDLAETPSIEELAGLLPAVCLYTPDDLRLILARYKVQIA